MFSGILLGKLPEGVRNRALPLQRNRRVADRVAAEALPDGVHCAIGRPARDALAGAGAAFLVGKTERELELQRRLLAEMGDGDGEQRDDLLPPVVGERR